jgi:hypothetical protein
LRFQKLQIAETGFDGSEVNVSPMRCREVRRYYRGRTTEEIEEEEERYLRKRSTVLVEF